MASECDICSICDHKSRRKLYPFKMFDEWIFLCLKCIKIQRSIERERKRGK